MQPVAACGLRAHSGWAVLVVVAASRGTPTLLDRRRLALADELPAQPYHQAARLQDAQAAARFVEAARADIGRRADRAIASTVADAARAGYALRHAALLTSQARPLPLLEAILRSHPLLHTAEGELFRQALANACEQSGLQLFRCRERDVYEQSGRGIGVEPAALRRHVTAIGRTAGPPWTADHKMAFVAAWALLAPAGTVS